MPQNQQSNHYSLARTLVDNYPQVHLPTTRNCQLDADETAFECFWPGNAIKVSFSVLEETLNSQAGHGVAGHAATFYAREIAGLPYFPPAEGRLDAEVAVIGGGLAGLTCALELARYGKRVILLETRRLAHAASGRNAGFVSPGFARSLFELEAALGLEHARELFRLSHEGAAYVRRQLREAGDPPDILSGIGALKFIRHGDSAGLERKVERLAHDYGYPQSFLTRRELISHVTTDRYHAAILDMNAFQINPLRYASLLAGLARQAGAGLYENSHATTIRKSAKGGWKVQTAEAVIEAKELVLATSAGRGPSRRLNGAIVPVATHVVTARSANFSGAIRFGGAMGDTRRASDYYRLAKAASGETLLLWGGRITARVSQPKSLRETMRRDILSVFPQLSDIEIIDAWTGIMGYTVHKMPLISQLDGAWAMTGFGGHGVNTSAMAGAVVAAAIAEGDRRHRLFDPFKALWAGGILGRVGAEIEYMRLGILDRFEEIRARKTW
jgi:glycine/D-amino acid oxidase-like deaminating enzyme